MQFNFDATQFEPNKGGQDVFEDGEYAFQITDSKVRENKKKDGHIMELTAKCIEEGFAGKIYVIRLNVSNPSAQAVEIAMGDLSAISHVTGVLQWNDTQQLHGKPFRMRLVKTTWKNEQGEDRHGNDCKGFLDMAGNPPGQAAQSGGGAPSAPGGGAPSAPPTPPQQQPVQQETPAAPPVQQEQAAPPAPPTGATPPWQK